MEEVIRPWVATSHPGRCVSGFTADCQGVPTEKHQRRVAPQRGQTADMAFAADHYELRYAMEIK
jgi:hypothetical protein